MIELIENIFKTTGTLSTEQIIMNIVMALVLGMVVFVSYVYTHSGTIYSTKFNVSLVMLSIVTAIVMTVIQNNIALSLGTIGALSIVRFRTAIKDPRDTIYIYFGLFLWAYVVVSQHLPSLLLELSSYLFFYYFSEESKILIVY